MYYITKIKFEKEKFVQKYNKKQGCLEKNLNKGITKIEFD